MVNASRGYNSLQRLGWRRLFDTISPCPLVFSERTVALEFLNVAELFQLISPDVLSVSINLSGLSASAHPKALLVGIPSKVAARQSAI